MLHEHIRKNLNINESELNDLLLKNKNYLNAENEITREKFFIFKTYYNFIFNPSCVSFIEKSYKILSEIILNDKKEYLSLLDKDMFITILILILKSNIYHRDFTNSDLTLNSDVHVNYCVDNFINYCIFHNLYMKNKQIRQFFLFFFNILIDNHLIMMKKIQYIDKNFYKTTLLYVFHTVNYQLIDDEYLNFSFCPFKLVEYSDVLYIHTYHFSRIYEMCKKNFFSNKSFKPKNINYLINKTNIKLFIDAEFKSSLKTANKGEILKVLYEQNLKLKEVYCFKRWTVDTKDEIAEIQKKYSLALSEYILTIFIDQNIDHPVYFPLFLDFRGRKYYNSSTGPTQSKMLRTAYFYGYYSKSDFRGVKPSPNLLKNYDLIKRICLEYKFEFEEYFYDIYFWCLIGIGKFLVEKSSAVIEEREFLLKANEILANRSIIENIKISDLLEINHYIRIMNSLNNENLENNKIKKRVIIKDATASVNQILMKKLGPINQCSMNYVNLGIENKWHDTYMIYKEKFVLKNEQNLKETDTSIILMRKLIKKIIMIVPYSAGFELCWKNYVAALRENNLNIEIDKNLKKIIKDFYIFVKKDMQEEFLYIKNSALYFKKIGEEFEKNKKFIIESETGLADISYYKMKRTSIEKRYTLNGVQKRVSKLILEPSAALDLKSFNSATGPNIAHFLDGDEIRDIEISMNKYFITIHDCYLVDMLSCSELIKAKQNHYKRFITNYKIDNIFILL